MVDRLVGDASPGRRAWDDRTRLADGRDPCGPAPPSLEDVTFAIRLAVVALFGDAILGRQLSQVDSTEHEGEHHRFRAWLAELLVAKLSRDPDPQGS